MKRNKTVLLKLTEEELREIDKVMKENNVKNRSAYIRKMVMQGYIFHFETAGISEISRLLSILSNNINQIAKIANSTGNIYEKDIDDCKINLNEIKIQFGKVLDELSKGCV